MIPGGSIFQSVTFPSCDLRRTGLSGWTGYIMTLSMLTGSTYIRELSAPPQVPVGFGQTTKRSALLNRQGDQGRWPGHKLSGCWLPLDAGKALSCLHFLSLSSLSRQCWGWKQRKPIFSGLQEICCFIYFSFVQNGKRRIVLSVRYSGAGRLKTHGLPSFPRGSTTGVTSEKQGIRRGHISFISNAGEGFEMAPCSKTPWL